MENKSINAEDNQKENRENQENIEKNNFTSADESDKSKIEENQINTDTNADTHVGADDPSTAVVGSRKKTKFSVMVFTSVVIFAVAIGVWAYSEGYLPLPGWLDDSGEQKAVSEAIVNMLDVKALTYEGSASVEILDGTIISGTSGTPENYGSSRNSKFLNNSTLGAVLVTILNDVGNTQKSVDSRPGDEFASVKFNGGFDMLDQNSSVAMGKMSFSVSDAMFGSIDLTAEYRQVDNKIYVRLSGLPNMGLDLSAFTDKWIVIDLMELVEQYSPENAGQVRHYIDNPSENRLTDAEKNMLSDGYIKTPVFDVVGATVDKGMNERADGGQDDFDGVKKYKITLNKDGLIEMLKHIIKISENRAKTFGNDTSGFEGYYDDYDEEFAEDLNNALSGIRVAEGYIWISPHDNLVRRLDLNFEISDDGASIDFDSRDSTKAGKTNNNEWIIKAHFDVAFDNFDKPLKVDVPLQTQTLDEVMAEVFRSMQLGEI